MADKKEKTDKKEGRQIVVPGEVVISGDDYLPGDFTRKDGKDIIAQRYGIAETGLRVVKIIPISGVFEARRGNTVIGIVEDTTFNGWIVDVGGPYSAFLPLMEVPRYIDKNGISEFANVGDALSFKISSIRKSSIDLSLKSRGLGKLEGGRLIKINSHKVPRVIGKEGSMINLIKDNTRTEITVGQNGYVWVKGEVEGEKKAIDAINLVVDEAINSGLTEKVEKFLGVKK